MKVTWWAFWLGIVLVAAKAYHVAPPGGAGDYGRFVEDLAVVGGADAFFAAGFGIVTAAALLSVRRFRRIHRVLVALAVILAVVAAFYGILATHIFTIQRLPLTYAWLYVADDLGSMWSSIERYLTPSIIAQLVLVPLAYLVLVRLSSAFSRRRLGHRAWAIVPLLLAGATIPWWQFSRAAVAGEWGSRHDDRKLAENPHWVLVASFVEEWTGGATVTFNEAFPAEYAEDFLPVGARREGVRPTPGLRRGPKNVILVVLESVGTQHLQLYGSPYPTTPRLVQEAASALVFDHTYAHITNTANSLVTLTLGIYPPGLSYKEPTKESPRMAGTSVADVLKSKGYRTAFISSGDNAYANQGEFLAGRGFDVVWDWRDSGRPQLFTWGVEDAAMVDMIFRWLDQGGEGAPPFFVMCWTQGTHHPYEIPWEKPRIEFFGEVKPPDDWDLGKYLNALRETDDQLGRLFDGLKSRGLDRDTLVLITGDHGEAFYDPHPYVGHSYHVHEEDVHVPLVVWAPGLYPAAERASRVGGHVDLPPTILDLLDFAPPATWQGRSLFAEDHPSRAYFFGTRDSYYLGVREGPFKYVLDVSQGRETLYDLAADPREQKSAHAQHPELSRRLRQRLAAWFASSRK